METLADIAFRYGTDKKHTRHNFVEIYESLFEHKRQEPLKLLEIGVYLCRSHNMWLDYFPNATVYGIEKEEMFTQYSRDRLIIHRIDQGNKDQLLAYAEEHGPWDIIIDDGSHFVSHQKLALQVLWPFVKPGGYQFVEDTHSSYWGKFMDSDETLMQYVLKLTDHICRVPHYKGYYSSYSVRKQHEKLDFLQSTIEEITYRVGMVYFKKRKET